MIDTIIRTEYQGATDSYVGRKLKFTLLKKTDSKSAELAICSTLEMIENLDHETHTITCDNDNEMSRPKDITLTFKTNCYFTTPYHSGEIGLNEHTNSLLRRYIPKIVSISVITDDLAGMI